MKSWMNGLLVVALSITTIEIAHADCDFSDPKDIAKYCSGSSSPSDQKSVRVRGPQIRGQAPLPLDSLKCVQDYFTANQKNLSNRWLALMAIQGIKSWKVQNPKKDSEGIPNELISIPHDQAKLKQYTIQALLTYGYCPTSAGGNEIYPSLSPNETDEVNQMLRNSCSFNGKSDDCSKNLDDSFVQFNFGFGGTSDMFKFFNSDSDKFDKLSPVERQEKFVGNICKTDKLGKDTDTKKSFCEDKGSAIFSKTSWYDTTVESGKTVEFVTTPTAMSKKLLKCVGYDFSKKLADPSSQFNYDKMAVYDSSQESKNAYRINCRNLAAACGLTEFEFCNANDPKNVNKKRKRIEDDERRAKNQNDAEDVVSVNDDEDVEGAPVMAPAATSETSGPASK